MVRTQPDFETHGGEDVAIFASGPMSFLFRGMHEQSYIAQVMGFAACVGPDKSHCTENTGNYCKQTTSGAGHSGLQWSSVVATAASVLLSARLWRDVLTN